MRVKKMEAPPVGAAESMQTIVVGDGVQIKEIFL